MRTRKKLLGGLSFVSRTFEGTFKENPYVLDMDANLYIGPADHLSRDEHSAIEVVYHFLRQTGRIDLSLRDLLGNRLRLLEAFHAFDEARSDAGADEFRVLVFGTYDGELLAAGDDDDLPAGPCGMAVNELKQRFYAMCQRKDEEFGTRQLGPEHRQAEARFTESV
jgi:hypothetical protein